MPLDWKQFPKASFTPVFQQSPSETPRAPLHFERPFQISSGEEVPRRRVLQQSPETSPLGANRSLRRPAQLPGEAPPSSRERSVSPGQAAVMRRLAAERADRAASSRPPPLGAASSSQPVIWCTEVAASPVQVSRPLPRCSMERAASLGPAPAGKPLPHSALCYSAEPSVSPAQASRRLPRRSMERAASPVLLQGPSPLPRCSMKRAASIGPALPRKATFPWSTPLGNPSPMHGIRIGQQAECPQAKVPGLAPCSSAMLPPAVLSSPKMPPRTFLSPPVGLADSSSIPREALAKLRRPLSGAQ